MSQHQHTLRSAPHSDRSLRDELRTNRLLMGDSEQHSQINVADRSHSETSVSSRSDGVSPRDVSTADILSQPTANLQQQFMM